ncbi:unnamed protein product, partial [Musa acuminata subsp. burmannicoides]
LSGSGSCPTTSSALGGEGFELRPNGTASFSAPPGWSGRFWVRTGCAFAPFSASGTCDTGDCGCALRCTTARHPGRVHPRWILIRRPGLLRREPRRRVQRRRWGAPIVGGGNCRYTGCAADGGCDRGDGGLRERVRGVRGGVVLLHRGPQLARVVRAKPVLAALQGRLRGGVQLRLRRRDEHDHLRRRHGRLHRRLLSL